MEELFKIHSTQEYCQIRHRLFGHAKMFCIHGNSTGPAFWMVISCILVPASKPGEFQMCGAFPISGSHGLRTSRWNFTPALQLQSSKGRAHVLQSSLHTSPAALTSLCHCVRQFKEILDDASPFSLIRCLLQLHSGCWNKFQSIKKLMIQEVYSV